MPNSKYLETVEYSASGVKKTLNAGDLTIDEMTRCKGLEHRITLPIKNNAGSGNIKGTLAKALTFALKTFTLAAGFQQAQKFWDSEVGSNLLLAHRECYGSVPTFSGTGGATDSYAGSTGLPGGSSETLTFYVRVPFENWRMRDRRRLALGSSQFSTLYWENICGIASDLDSSGNIVLNGTMSIDLYANLTPGPDMLSPGIAWRKNSRTGLWVTLDAMQPMLFAESSNAYSGNAFDLVDVIIGSFKAKGDRVAAIQDYHLDCLMGQQDVSDTVTVLAEQEPNSDYDNLPAGVPMLKQPTNEQTELNVIGLGPLPLSGARLNDTCKAIAQALGVSIHVIVGVASGHNGVPVKNLDYVPCLIAKPGDPQYDAQDAIVLDKNGNPAGTYSAPNNNAGSANLAKIQQLSTIPGALSKTTNPKVAATIVLPASGGTHYDGDLHARPGTTGARAPLFRRREWVSF